jgi:hypothetical protein
VALVEPRLAKVEGNRLTPLADGATTLAVTHGGQTVNVPVTVKSATAEQPVSFKLDVMPVFMKVGCNNGSCHGAARGKDGFHLSLFGYDPDGDFQRITRQVATRRVNLALPAESLLIQKSIGAVQHTGGAPVKPGSADHATLLRWVEAGAPQDAADVATPVSLEILPQQAVLEEGATHRTTVRAKYSDGTDRDVTDLALFQSNNDAAAKIGPGGLVTRRRRAARRSSWPASPRSPSARRSSPSQGLKYEWPTSTPENNYVDGLVNAKLKKLRILPSELCDDATFLRRAYLDIVGALPPPERFAAFTADATRRSGRSSSTSCSPATSSSICG